MADIKTQRGDAQFPLRFPEGMRERIKVAADANGRSMNAEIIALISSGMDELRDKFAGQALAGILAGGFADTIPHDDVNGGGDAAFFAYQYADAMIAARKGGAA